MTYRERREARAARLRGWAETRRAKSAAAFTAAETRAAHIPMGQPILIGHHSERRHRRDIARIDQAMTRGIEHQATAARMTTRADEIDRQAERSTYRDDPDVIAQLNERIASLEATRDRRRTINQEIRRGPGWEARITPPLTNEERVDLASAARFSAYVGYPPYSLQNLAGNIRRQRLRLQQLQQENRA